MFLVRIDGDASAEAPGVAGGKIHFGIQICKSVRVIICTFTGSWEERRARSYSADVFDLLVFTLKEPLGAAVLKEMAVTSAAAARVVPSALWSI